MRLGNKWKSFCVLYSSPSSSPSSSASSSSSSSSPPSLKGSTKNGSKNYKHQTLLITYIEIETK